jgi:hypothetical protein
MVGPLTSKKKKFQPPTVVFCNLYFDIKTHEQVYYSSHLVELLVKNNNVVWSRHIRFTPITVHKVLNTHPLPTCNKDALPKIIVKFTRRNVRNKFYVERKTLAGKNLKDNRHVRKFIVWDNIYFVIMLQCYLIYAVQPPVKFNTATIIMLSVT